jgi:hypothetical protein
MKANQWRPEDSSPAHGDSPEDAEIQDAGAPPAAGTRAGAAPGAPAAEPPHVPSSLDSTQMAESPASSTRIADDPLAGKQPADDPLGSDPLTLDRKNASRRP